MKKNFIVTSTTLLLIIGLIIWATVWMHSPARGRIITASAPNKTGTNLSDKKLEGTYISFDYKGEYAIRSEVAGNGTLERYTLDAGTQYNKQIRVSVSALPDGQLSSNGDYIYRDKSNVIYSNRKLKTAAGLVEIWVKKDGSEQTAMIPRGNKLAVVSFVADPGSNIDLTPEVNTLLTSLEWKQ